MPSRSPVATMPPVTGQVSRVYQCATSPQVQSSSYLTRVATTGGIRPASFTVPQPVLSHARVVRSASTILPSPRQYGLPRSVKVAKAVNEKIVVQPRLAYNAKTYYSEDKSNKLGCQVGGGSMSDSTSDPKDSVYDVTSSSAGSGKAPATEDSWVDFVGEPPEGVPPSEDVHVDVVQEAPEAAPPSKDVQAFTRQETPVAEPVKVSTEDFQHRSFCSVDWQVFQDESKPRSFCSVWW